MGMFDSINCEVELPGEPKPPANRWLQTKDFDCLLDTYTIRADGTLWKKEFEEREQEQVNFHGLLNFYTYENDIWYEYNAKFTDGKLVAIEPVRIYRNGAGGPQEVFYPTEGKNDGRA